MRCSECDMLLSYDDEEDDDNIENEDAIIMENVDGLLFCEDCYYDTQVKTCALCNKLFEFKSLQEPDKFYFCLSKEMANAQNITNSVTGKSDILPGIYRANKFPFKADAFPFDLDWIGKNPEIIRRYVVMVHPLPDNYSHVRHLQICENCIRDYFLPRKHRQYLKEMNSQRDKGLSEMWEKMKAVYNSFYTKCFCFFVVWVICGALLQKNNVISHPAYWYNFPEKAEQIACRLIDSGKIEQPRLQGKEPPVISRHRFWE